MAELFKTYCIESGVPGPEVLITAGVHGDEQEPVIAAQSLLQEITARIIKGKVIIIPVVNVSAFNLNSRCGVDGMDLARTCPGRDGGSLTEQVAWDLSAIVTQSNYYIDLHTGGKTLDIFPLSGYMLHTSPAILEAQRKMAEAFGFPVIWGTDATAEGRTLSVARDAKIPAIYVEYGGPEPMSEKIIQAYIDGCLNVLAHLSLIMPVSEKKKQYSYWVEDHRLNSGHLQSKTPAPMQGLYYPVAKAGTIVSAGDLWGVIQNPATRELTEIKSNTDGLVLLTRVKGPVNKDETLGGTLPLSKPGKLVINEQA